MTSDLSLREKVLLMVAGLVVLIIGYLFLRYLPQQQAIAAIESGAESAEREYEEKQKELNEAVASPKAVVDEETLQGEVDALRRELEQQQARLSELRLKTAPVDDAESLQQLKLEIAMLAKRAGVHVLESRPLEPEATRSSASAEDDEPAAAAGPFLPADLIREATGGRLHTMTVESSFPALREFLDGLRRLPWRVTVLSFDIEILKNEKERFGSRLRTTCVMAF